MSDVPVKEIELVPNSPASVGSSPPAGYVTNKSVQCAYEKPPGGLVWSFLLLALAAVVGSVPGAKWAIALNWLTLSWPAETVRWIATLVLGVAGLSVLRRSPISFVVNSVVFAGAVYCVYDLLHARLSPGVEALCRGPAAIPLLAILSFAFGFATLGQTRAGATPNLRGVFGLALVAAASVGLAHGWFEWATVAGRIGPGATRLVENWGAECSWATVLILTALGVSCSRTRPIHFLNAVLLVALAYECVKSGYVEVKTFPELARGEVIPTVATSSYTNVETWRWIVAGELTILTAILLHMASGLGGLCVAFAVSWMIVGMAVYKSVGTMSFVRIGAMSLEKSMSGLPTEGPRPLDGMGLPAAQGQASQSPGGLASSGAAPAPRDTAAEQRRAMEAAARSATICEVTTLVWIALTALFAGFVCAVGLAMLSGEEHYRVGVLCALWFGLGIGAMALWSVWPRDPGQSWESWGAALKLSRYHLHGIWLLFLASAAAGSAWSFFLSRQPRSWSNSAAAAVFVGTAASLVGAAVLIRFGDFPPLPVWVYCVIAAGQSSLAWALLMQANRLPQPGMGQGRTA